MDHNIPIHNTLDLPDTTIRNLWDWIIDYYTYDNNEKPKIRIRKKCVRCESTCFVYFLAASVQMFFYCDKWFGNWPGHIFHIAKGNTFICIQRFVSPAIRTVFIRKIRVIPEIWQIVFDSEMNTMALSSHMPSAYVKGVSGWDIHIL